MNGATSSQSVSPPLLPYSHVSSEDHSEPRSRNQLQHPARQQINGPGPVLIGPLGLQKCLLIPAVYQLHWLPVVCRSPWSSREAYVLDTQSFTHILCCTHVFVHTSPYKQPLTHFPISLIILPFSLEHGVNCIIKGVRAAARIALFELAVAGLL